MDSDVRRYADGDTRLKIYRISKTGALFASWICLGLYNEVIGPTLLDLKERVGCNYEELSRVLSARSAGLFLGSFLGGVLHDRWSRHRDRLIALALVVSAVTIGVAPWCSSLWVLGVVFHLMGNSHALLTTGGNPTIAVLWADKSEGPYQFLHSGFGFGALLGPIISEPFLSHALHLNRSHDPSPNTTSHDYGLFANNSDSYGNQSTRFSQSRIEYPYGFVAICCAVVAFAFFVYSLLPVPAPFVLKQSKWSDIVDPRRCSGGQTAFGVQMLSLIFLFYLFIVGGERAFGKFIFSYVVESRLAMSKSTAAWLSVLYWVSFTAARLSTFLLARWIPIHYLLFAQATGTLASAILLNIFSESFVGIWVLTMTFGFFKSPLFPSGLGWANRYIELSSMTITVVNAGSSTGGMLVQWLTGYMFEYYGPHTFLYIIAGYAGAIFVLFVVMHVVANKHGDRFSEGGKEAKGVNVVLNKVTPTDDQNDKL